MGLNFNDILELGWESIHPNSYKQDRYRLLERGNSSNGTKLEHHTATETTLEDKLSLLIKAHIQGF